MKNNNLVKKKTFGNFQPINPKLMEREIYGADWTNELSTQKVPLYTPDGKMNENNLKKGGKVKNKYQSN